MQVEFDLEPKENVERVFLGWDRRLLDLLIDWLWERKEEFPSMMIVAPTAQSGRRLREGLAARGGCLAPRVVTPSYFFRSEMGGQGDLAELLAWEEVFATVDWSEYEAIMPVSDSSAEDFGRGLAKQLRSIRSELAEVGMDVAFAARRLGESHPERERWNALAQLEKAYRREMGRLGYVDPQDEKRRLAREFVVPEGVTQLIIAGVPDPVALSQQVWQRWSQSIPVRVLVHAPEGEARSFDDWGRPDVDAWKQSVIDVAGGNDAIRVCDTPLHQAESTLRAMAESVEGVAEIGREDVTLGVCDPSLFPEVSRVFGERGWHLFDPAGRTLSETGLIAWLEALRQWVLRDDVRSLAALVPQVWTERLLGKEAFWLSLRLARVVDMALPQHSGDFRKVAEASWLGESTREKAVREAADEMAKVCGSLGYWRERFQMVGAAVTLRELLVKILEGDPCAETVLTAAAPLLDEVESLEKKTSRLKADRWLGLMITALSSLRVETDNESRSLDAQGWLELSYEPAPQMVVCGFNEGLVPESALGDPWLPNAMRALLGLKDNLSRYARDAFYTTSFVESRRADGGVTFLYGRRAMGGEPMKPSRLLLKSEREVLPQRVKHAFSAPKAVTQGKAWERDWKLEVPKEDVPDRMSVTGLGQYLACPFRYYLKHILRMQRPEELREEWSAREFGTILHEVLETFGRDKEAKNLTHAESLTQWMWRCLDEVVAERFSGSLPLAIEVQIESARQRLGAFARAQVERRQAGWEIHEVELSFAVEVGGVTYTGKIDRIDYHPQLDQWMVWDYKTGKDANAAKSAHCVQVTTRTVIPEHLSEREEFLFEALGRSSKPVGHVWRGLQLPLYSLALWKERGKQAGVGYISLSPVLSEVGFCEWKDYDFGITAAAESAVEAVSMMLQETVFWPPAEKPRYDDYQELLDGELMAEAFEVDFAEEVSDG